MNNDTDYIYDLENEERETLLRLLDKLKPFPNMDYLVLQKIWQRRFFPMITIELLLFDRPYNSSDAKVLLVQRDDEYFKNCWTLTGKFLAPNQQISEALLSIAQKECGVSEVCSPLFVGQFSHYNMQRLHTFSSVFIAYAPSLATIAEKQHQLFELSNLPESLIDTQKVIVTEVRAYIHSLSTNKRAATSPFFECSALI